MNFTSLINSPLIKGWIIRLFREARADLSASYDIEEPYVSANLIIQSMKKLQKAIFYCLGEPESIQELLLYKATSSSLFYEILITLQNVINYWLQKILSFENFVLSEVLTDAKEIFNLTKIFITNFIGEKIPYQIETFPEKPLS